MHPFTHRLEIHTESPILKAAYDIAKEAHWDSGQGRGKQDLPYLVHPIMLYDLMVDQGITDEITLAAALLHDAKEDYQPFMDDASKMRVQLGERLAHYGVTDAAEIAYYIDELCDELTNGAEMIEGKRTWQVEHVGKISLRSATVKIFDQMASVLDNILSPDDGVGNRWSQNWSYKALDVVKATAEQRPQLGYYRDLFKVLFSYNMKILNAETPEEAAQLRADFNWNQAMEKAHAMDESSSPDEKVAKVVTSKDIKQATQGVIELQLTDKGNVAYYAPLMNPQGGKGDARNEAAVRLMGEIESSATTRRVSVGARDVLHGRMVRVNKIKPAMPLAEFLNYARSAQSVSQVFETQVRDASRELNASLGKA